MNRIESLLCACLTSSQACTPSTQHISPSPRPFPSHVRAQAKGAIWVEGQGAQGLMVV